MDGKLEQILGREPVTKKAMVAIVQNLMAMSDNSEVYRLADLHTLKITPTNDWCTLTSFLLECMRKTLREQLVKYQIQGVDSNFPSAVLLNGLQRAIDDHTLQFGIWNLWEER